MKQVPWSGWCLGGRSSAKDCRGVVVAGALEVLVVGKAEDCRAVAVIPEALVTGTTERLRSRVPEAVMETAEQQPA